MLVAFMLEAEGVLMVEIVAVLLVMLMLVEKTMVVVADRKSHSNSCY